MEYEEWGMNMTNITNGVHFSSMHCVIVYYY